MDKKINSIKITQEMKTSYTLLFPNMLDIHFHLLQNILIDCGYHVELLTNNNSEVINDGLRYVHNDMCYPALVTIGQMINALKSDKYDLNKTMLVLSQTGGGCRASNYVYLLKKALKNADLEEVPVLTFNLADPFDKNGINVSVLTLRKILSAMEYGDLLMLLGNHVRPYEIHKGETNLLIQKWIDKLSELFNQNRGYSFNEMKKYNKYIVEEFKMIQIKNVQKIKVGVVGEIFVKFSYVANNDLVNFLESQDCEVSVPGIMGFLMYALDMPTEDIRLYGGDKFVQIFGESGLKYVSRFEKLLINSTKGYLNVHAYADLKKSVEGYIGTGCKMGEGWLLVSETIELINSGYKNVICVQPFGCLPNHIVGKGMMKKIRSEFPDSNIVAIDYDPGVSKVNQENRIRLMLAIAKDK